MILAGSLVYFDSLTGRNYRLLPIRQSALGLVVTDYRLPDIG